MKNLIIALSFVGLFGCAASPHSPSERESLEVFESMRHINCAQAQEKKIQYALLNQMVFWKAAEFWVDRHCSAKK